MAWPVATTKRTYYQNRGKVHLMNTKHVAWCGVKSEDSNHITAKKEDCTCQKCLMIMTRNWKPRAKKK